MELLFIVCDVATFKPVNVHQKLHGYTSSDLEQKRAALKKLEAAVLRKPQPQTPVGVSASGLME
jgi:hypothetical protein